MAGEGYNDVPQPPGNVGQNIADGFFGNQNNVQQPPGYGQPVYGQPAYGQPVYGQPSFQTQPNYVPQQQQVIIVNSNNSHGEHCQVCGKST